MVTTSHMWLSLIICKLIKTKANLKFSSSCSLAKFQVLNSHMWPVATLWTPQIHRPFPSSRKVLLDSSILDQRLAHFFVNGQAVNFLVLWNIRSLSQLLSSAAVPKSSNRQYVNEWTWLCSNKPLLTKQTGGRICPMSLSSLTPVPDLKLGD